MRFIRGIQLPGSVRNRISKFARVSFREESVYNKNVRPPNTWIYWLHRKVWSLKLRTKGEEFAVGRGSRRGLDNILTLFLVAVNRRRDVITEIIQLEPTCVS
jgi:hypothetical protein